MAEELVSLPASDDVPLEDNIAGDVPNLFDENEAVIRQEPFSIRGTNLGHAAILKNHIDGEHPVQAFANFSAEENTNALLQKLAGIKAQVDSQDIVDVFVENPGETVPEMAQNTSIYKEMIAQAEAKAADIPQQIVEAASSLDSDERIQNKIKAQLTVLKTVQDLVKDYSTLEMIGDAAKAFIPGKQILDNIQATDSVFGADDVMRDLIVGFKSLSAEDQIEKWPFIKEHLLDTLPKGRAISVMSKFMDPTGEDDLSDFNAFWAALDLADVTFVGAGIAKRIVSLQKNLNGIKMLKDLESTELASDIAAGAVLDTTGNTAKAAGVDDVTAVNNASPFDVSDLDAAYASGISTETLKRIEDVKNAQESVVRSIASEKDTLKEAFLTEPERAASEAKFVKGLVEEGFENIRVVDRSVDSTKFSYAWKSEGETVEDVARLDLQFDDAGRWETSAISRLKAIIASPSVFAKAGLKDAFQQAVRLDALSAKVGNQLRVLQREALAPLLGKTGIKGLDPEIRLQLADLDTVLLQGDEASILYTPIELRSGVNGVKLNDNQIETYYNVRNLYDNIFSLRNVEERRKLVAQGMREIQLGEDSVEVGKVLDSAQSASSSIRSSDAKSVWHLEEGKSIAVGDLDLPKLYEEGFVLSRLKQPTKMTESGDSYQSVLIRKANHLDLPEQVLHFKEGYVPRVNKNAYWFVKSYTPLNVDGDLKVRGSSNTLRFFDNKKEADEFAETLKKDDPAGDYKALEDREMERQIVGDSNIGSGGGLYTGARAKEKIPFGPDGLPSERFGAFEALSLNIGGLQNFVTRNQWRLGMEKRWTNTAAELGVKVDGFEPRLAPVETEAGRFLRKAGEQIEEWAGFPSKSELSWDGLVQDTLEWAVNTADKGPGLKFLRGEKVTSAIHYLKHKDPISSARSMAFHTLLGVFNPVQMWVQAQGASVALTMATKFSDPLGAVRAIKNQTLLGMASRSEGSKEALANIAKAGGIKTTELQEMLTLWKKTGLEDSILTTADHSASVSGHGIGSDALRRAADAGLFFYRGGELFNRRTSFLVALREFQSANKGAKVGDKELKRIITRANDFMLNLTKANKASWQKGIASIPTQFMQVTAKTLESLLGLNGQFDRGERAKLMFGQLALYGAAGVPLGNMAVRWYSESMGLTQTDVEELDPELVKGINEGFWGYLALSAFDADVELGVRGAVSSGVGNLVSSLLFSDAPISETLVGAFGSVPLGFYQAFREIKPMVLGELNSKTGVNDGTILKSLDAIASISSTWKSVRKARFMHYFNQMINRRGEVIIEKDFSIGTEVATALGFQPSDAVRVRDLQQLNKMLQEERNDRTTDMVNLFWNYSRELRTADTEEEKADIIDKFDSAKKLLMNTLPTPADRDIVREAVARKLTNPKSKAEREVVKFIKNFNDGRTGDIEDIKATLTAKGLIQTGAILQDTTIEQE